MPNRNIVKSKNVLKDGSWTHSGKFKEKPCVVCGAIFKPKSGVHKHCSEKCKGKWKYITGVETTENQYRKISGNWSRYFARLKCRTGKRINLTVQDLTTLLEKQNNKCALSGIELTCVLEKSVRCQTNASIDRIIAGGEYSIENIQLVCSVLNRLRIDTPINEFIEWCKKVAKYNE